jgi:hypothetical protein
MKLKSKIIAVAAFACVLAAGAGAKPIELGLQAKCDQDQSVQRQDQDSSAVPEGGATFLLLGLGLLGLAVFQRRSALPGSPALR